jgi:hypothetical protein
MDHLDEVYSEPHEHILNPRTCRCIACFALYCGDKYLQPTSPRAAFLEDVMRLQRHHAKHLAELPKEYGVPVSMQPWG